MAVTKLDGIGFGRGDRAVYASRPEDSRGRLIAEPESRTRTPFQRDRDRIVHSTAFRRLNHKTQVFFSHESDHYRTRLTHTMEVAQIARALARAFKLDEDLAEAIALAHDFGHTPFGHTGEDVLDHLMRDHGGFDHNAQALRVVTALERRYADFDGLNLTWDTLEGLVKHNGPLGEGGNPVPTTITDYCKRHDLEIAQHASLEAQVAAIADDIAYNTHDIDDGLRAGLLTLDMLKEVQMIAGQLEVVDEIYPDLDHMRRVHEMTRRVMTAMVEDVIAQTLENIRSIDPQSAQDVRRAGTTFVTFSDQMTVQENELKKFMFKNMYRHRSVMRVREQAEQVVEDLFVRFVEKPELMGVTWAEAIDEMDLSTRMVRIADYLAGMTDSYALATHRQLFDQTPDLR